MNCPQCQTANPEGARFCMNCGSALTITCPNCGTKGLPMGVKFCPECGHAFEESKGERRVVSILFCDVTGSTSMAGLLDPEEWTEIMNQAFEYFTRPVARYDGTVARLMGDAILAFFGAPKAHEDDPQRAVLVGLEIVSGVQEFREQLRQSRSLDFNVRVGINTGLVVVGAVGSDQKIEYTAMGDAVNLAARMEQTAQPGTVQITEETYRLVSSLFDVQALGKIEVKGKQEPVDAYRVLGRREGAVPTRGIQGLQSPLVGREQELRLLQERVQDLGSGTGSLVSVIGEAGLGKSRLVAELKKWALSQTAPPLWLEGRSLSYETSTAYAPFARLLTDFFDLHSLEAGSILYEKIKSKTEELAGDRAVEIAPYIATMLGISPTGEDADRVLYLQPPQVRERIFAAVPQLVQHIIARQSLVLVIEDLHWVDQTSLELIEQMLALPGRGRLLLLAIFRPQKQDRSWRFHEMAGRVEGGRYLPLALEPLSEQESRTLVANLLEIEDLPEKVRALILRKAEGNPFFVEEVIRSLLDAHLVVRENSHWLATQDIQEIKIPDTLTGVITARLDRLDGETRRITQTAAVIGREFTFPTLAEVYTGNTSSQAQPALRAGLDELQRRELVREKDILKHAYLFKHVLTQETAYASLLLSKRRDLHRRVAECLERTEPDRVNDIAHHFLAARLDQRALPYLVEAADRAARSYSVAEAVAYYSQALKILPIVDDNILDRRAFEGMGRMLTFTNNTQGAVENYQAMHRTGVEKDDAPMQVSALNKLSDIVAMRLGDFPEAEKLLFNSEHLARQEDDLPGLAELFMIRCGICMSVGDFDAAVNYLSESVQIGERMNLKEQMALGLVHIANTQLYMTQYDQAWETAQKSRRISEEIGNRELLAEVKAFAIPFYLWREGEIEAARQAAAESANIAEQIGAAFPDCVGSYAYGMLSLEMGEYEKAIHALNRSARAGQAAGMTFMEAIPLCVLGSVYLEISPELLSKATSVHAEALRLIDLPGGAIAGGVGWAELGFCALAMGEIETADEFFEKGITTPSPQMLLNRPKYLVGRALVASNRGEYEEASTFLSEARNFIEERGMRHFIPLITLAEAQISADRGLWEDALEGFRRAEQAAAAMNLRPKMWRARLEAARILDALGRGEEAATLQQSARAEANEIAAMIDDSELRALYLETVEKKQAGVSAS